jgi:Zn-dependent protease with chaperone function
MMIFGTNTQNMRRQLWAQVFGLALLPALAACAFADVTERVQRVVDEVRQSSYPELQGISLHLQLFTSDSDYFQARFTSASFLGRKKLRYVLFVNRQLFAPPPPEDGLRAILAHELGHLVYYQSHCRLQLLSLARLATPGFAARFERATDLLAIERGYGSGLKAYREWLYQRIPAHKLREKQRNYFSPAEIDAVLRRLQAQPALLQRWRKQPPRSLAEIEQ